MFGKAMRFATVCTLVFAICGTASRDKVAAVSKGTTEDLQHLFTQETNFEDNVSTTSLCPRGVRRLAVILSLSSAATSADAFANPNLATPHVSAHDIKLYANRQGEEAQAQAGPPAQITPADVESSRADVTPLGLGLPTEADIEAFRSFDKEKFCRPMFTVQERPGGYPYARKTPKFNVLEEYTRPLGKLVYGLDLSPEEKSALRSYTFEYADIINQIAMGADTVEFIYGEKAGIRCTLTKEDMLPWLKILNAGLKKMPSAAAGRLYRGVGFNAEGTPGSIAPITGFASFSEDFNVAKCFAEGKRKDGIQPTIFVMDKHSTGRQLEQIRDILFPDHKEVVFGVGTKFVIEEDEKVQREVEALWRENLAAGRSYDGYETIQPRRWLHFKKKEAVPDFKVVVVKEVWRYWLPTDEA